MIYITEEKLKELLAGAPEHLRPVPSRRMVAFDVETPNTRGDRICSAGLTVIENNRVIETREIRVNPETDFDWRCIRVHGIHPEDVEDEPAFPEVWDSIRDIMDIIINLTVCRSVGRFKGIFQLAILTGRPIIIVDAETYIDKLSTVCGGRKT